MHDHNGQTLVPPYRIHCPECFSRESQQGQHLMDAVTCLRTRTFVPSTLRRDEIGCLRKVHLEGWASLYRTLLVCLDPWRPSTGRKKGTRKYGQRGANPRNRWRMISFAPQRRKPERGLSGHVDILFEPAALIWIMANDSTLPTKPFSNPG
ncbi:hypothetical protein K469DRAFT_381211 [Zopfia rhizophila CBS 207.26]|uniref:Uncharacterized protein n=1 Tax=Zopfia rhizophila CBS 207.26 TaxID=1314779 RepID=A0A6A6DD80_9PEZI|nr:hypothetical protein K469DRAFT_381211 [Zopfia rhizophila CBS 207.26]